MGTTMRLVDVLPDADDEGGVADDALPDELDSVADDGLLPKNADGMKGAGIGSPCTHSTSPWSPSATNRMRWREINAARPSKRW